MAKFVDVYSKRTGKKQQVPEHYLKNPALMRPFSLTPKQRNADQPPPPPKDPDADQAPATHRTTETAAAADKE